MQGNDGHILTEQGRQCVAHRQSHLERQRSMRWRHLSPQRPVTPLVHTPDGRPLTLKDLDKTD